MRRRMTGSTPNKALELTAVAWGNVAVFHVYTRFAGLPFVVGGSSAGTFDAAKTYISDRITSSEWYTCALHDREQ